MNLIEQHPLLQGEYHFTSYSEMKHYLHVTFKEIFQMNFDPVAGYIKGFILAYGMAKAKIKPLAHLKGCFYLHITNGYFISISCYENPTRSMLEFFYNTSYQYKCKTFSGFIYSQERKTIQYWSANNEVTRHDTTEWSNIDHVRFRQSICP